MGRPFAAPPKVPADRVTALRRAFDQSLKDPELLAEAEKAAARNRAPSTARPCRAWSCKCSKRRKT